ncbi:MAG: hypothetical protein HOC91_13425 [Nitrospinaceae bacterium]|jgi:chromosome segregation ATPase|nr:hypothetical protein [Nitrospinaceae bacterium]MBT3433671.1 hypothetical protein [Nitrospinaceae bacterium]MBT3819985.1 hypothetical protein [Nitrospinaceae bacterium]MBT4095526.1 hypothetical protein [Nitrospinaceae bacterium]MBT4431508.1 hypothetical protein [Nitrospinaceae bacterium]
MNDGPTDPASQINSETSRITELVKVSEQERERLEKSMDLLTLRAEELTSKRSVLDEVGTRIADLESRLVKTEKRSETFEKVDVRITESERHFQKLDEFVRKTKMDIDGLNVLSEHVLAKTRSLNLQREVVEKSNEEAGKLNVLLWEMESKIKNLQEENKLVKRTEKSVAKLEGIYDSVRTKIDDAFQLRDIIAEVNLKVVQFNQFSQNFDEKLQQVDREKLVFENFSKRSTNFRRSLNEMEQSLNELNERVSQVETLRGELDTVKPALESMRIESQNILSKNDALLRTSARIQSLEDQNENLQQAILRVREERHEVEEVWENVHSLRDFLANEVERRAERLKRELDESSTLRRMIQDYHVSARELREQLNTIPEGLKVAEEARQRASEINEIDDALRQKMEDTQNRVRLVEHIKGAH